MTDDWLRATTRQVKLAQIDTTVPNVARVWNYLVGGRDNFDADRRAARQLVAVAPVMGDVAHASRAFLRRVVTYLAGEAGIRQFLDIGTGIPTAGNTHEIAQQVAPECRIVYVDNDPMVLVHARALLRSSPEGITSYIDADARDPGKIIAGAQDTLDFSEPVAIVMIDVVNFIEGTREVGAIIRTLLDAVPSGSYIVLMQPAVDDDLLVAQRRWNQISPVAVWLRDRDEVASWLTGLELAEPGIVDVDKWRPADGDPEYPDGMPLYGAVARKPLRGGGFVGDDWRQDAARRAKVALIDTSTPNPARVGDYLYGGPNNFEADRKAARTLIAAAPATIMIAPAARAFHQRVVRYLAGEARVTQFIDIGTSLAVAGRTHEVAQDIDPQARVVYASSDPMVLAHARALMRSTARGAIGFADADVREPDAIIADARTILDFGRPVAVLLLSTLATIADNASACAVVSSLAAAVPSGSYIALYHVASDLDPAMPLAAREWNKMSSQPATLRSQAEITRLLTGLEPVPPGLVPIPEWRPAVTDPRFENLVPVYGVVARKP